LTSLIALITNKKTEMFLSRLFNLFSCDMSIDLGTANTLVYVKNRGIVLQEPSIVAIQKGTRNVLAVGDRAKEMVGRTPGNIIAIRPLRDGVIADFQIAQEMLRYFILTVHRRRSFARPRIIIGVPSGITEVERRAVEESAIRAGAIEVYLIEEPMAAAIGAGLAVEEPVGNMIVDIGGGTTEVAVISLSGIVVTKCIRIAGDEMDEAIIDYLKRNYNLLVGERTAERVKVSIGSAYPVNEERTVEIKGRDLGTGLPKVVKVTSEEIREALSEPVSFIVAVIRDILEKTPPELSADIAERGICLAGGGAALKGLDVLLHKETHLPVYVAQDPLTCVVLGSGKCLDNINLLRNITMRPRVYE
jgi:rod shape-determining protein MreB